MPEVKLTECDECKSVVQEAHRTCKRCLNIAYERELSDIRAGHIANLIANKYAVDVHIFEEITDRQAMQSVDDYLNAWADEQDFIFKIKFDNTNTCGVVWKNGIPLMGDVVKLSKTITIKNGKKRTDQFDRKKGRIIAKLRIYNLWVGGAF